MDVLSDRDTHHSIVSKLHTRAVISQEVMVAQMSSAGGSDRGSSLLTVLDLEDKPHKLRELITAMMEEENVRPLAEEMTAMLNKTDQGANLSSSMYIAIDLTYMHTEETNLMKSSHFESSSGKVIDYYNALLSVIIVVQEQAAVIAQLNTKLKSIEKNLEDANKCIIRLFYQFQYLILNFFKYSIRHERETNLIIAV